MSSVNTLLYLYDTFLTQLEFKDPKLENIDFLTRLKQPRYEQQVLRYQLLAKYKPRV